VTAASDDALRSWLGRRVPQWRRVSALLQDLTRARAPTTRDAFDLAEGYRTVARDLSMARRVMPTSRTRQTLETLYAELHSMLHRPPHRFGSELMRLLQVDVPAIVRELRMHIAAVAALFLLSSFAAAWLITQYPDLVGLLLDEMTIAGVERGALWTDDLFNIAPPVLSVGIFANNIVVSIIAFAAGVFFGLGTFYIIGLNGLLLGGVFAFTAQHGLGWRLFEFVIAHGLVELSVICLAGAAGASLGEALIRPGAQTRREAFQAASSKAMKLLIACAILLVICGFIEGYISPDPSFPLASRVVIGVSYWALMILLLTGRLFRRNPVSARATQAPVSQTRLSRLSRA
jgi:uncharacterized membrane protein SpoIIM required for sporulation